MVDKVTWIDLASSTNDTMVPSPAMSDVPVFSEMILAKLKGEALAAYNTWLNDQLVDKWFALPPGTPAEFVTAYRVAFAKAVKDAEFLSRTKREFGEDFSPMNSEELGRFAKALAATKDEDLQFFNNLRTKYRP